MFFIRDGEVCPRDTDAGALNLNVETIHAARLGRVATALTLQLPDHVALLKQLTGVIQRCYSCLDGDFPSHHWSPQTDPKKPRSKVPPVTTGASSFRVSASWRDASR